jgi:bidirectional [NiFe] hydrogenase diaphorase subunit
MAETDRGGAAKPVTLTINNREVKAPEGMTVLEAARTVGIEIPTLCCHEKLTGYGACRLCVVELVKGTRSRIVASCLYPVEEGLNVQTESDRVVKHRQIILELMQARWPWIDEKLLEKCGVKKGRLEENATFCILCGLCVRHCSEVKKANVLGFVGRGTRRQVVLYPELAARACPTCGEGTMECVQICPTGVIPSDFAVIIPAQGKKPLVFPIRFRDDDNNRIVSEQVGDTEPKKK